MQKKIIALNTSVKEKRMGNSEFIVSERMFKEQCAKCAAVLGETEKLMVGDKDQSREARWTYLQKSESFYHYANQIFAKRLELKPKAKIPYYYEMMAIMEAMAISFGITSENDLSERDESDRFYDPEWIKKMAVEMHEHFRMTAEKGNCMLERS